MEQARPDQDDHDEGDHDDEYHDEGESEGNRDDDGDHVMMKTITVHYLGQAM